MILNSLSTLADIEAEYAETASYRITADVSLAERFVVACLRLIVALPTESSDPLSKISFSQQITALRQEADMARAWIEQMGGTQVTVVAAARRRPRYFSLQGYRD